MKTRYRKLTAISVFTALCMLSVMIGLGIQKASTVYAAPTLAQVTNVTFDSSGVATWDMVDNTSQYEVTLYQGGMPQTSKNVTAVSGSSISIPSYNFLSDIQASGPGDYSVRVMARGDGISYIDGPMSAASEIRTATKLATVSTGLTWSGNIAHWTTVADAESYVVQLYRNGSTVGTGLNVLAASAASGVDFTDVIGNTGGTYTFKVTTKGNGLLLDADQSASSTPKIIAIPLERTVATILPSGVLSWNAVPNATDYYIKMYRNGIWVLGVHDLDEGVTSFNFLSFMRISGANSYTYTVTALGDGTYYSNSAPSDLTEVYEIKKPAPVTELYWAGNMAHWGAVADAVSYDVQLYFNGTPVTDSMKNVLPENVVSGVDYSSEITSNGVGAYTFKVTPKGNSTHILDGIQSAASNPITKLPVTTGLTWSDLTAHWTMVDNAPGYEVQLYKDGIATGIPVTVPAANAAAGVDFEAAILSAGAGTYTYKVTAKGDSTSTLDSDQSQASENNLQSIVPRRAEFDLYSSSVKHTDITVSVVSGGAILTDIKNGTHALVSGTDYTVASQVFTIKKNYLTTLAKGTTTLTLTFSEGPAQSITIIVVDTTPPYFPPTQNPSTNGTRSVPIVIDNGETQTAATQIPITRTANRDGTTKDTLQLNEDLANEMAEQTAASNSNTATVRISNPLTEPADSIDIRLPKDSTTLLGQNNIAFHIETEQVTLLLPPETMAGLNETNAGITITEVTDKEKVEHSKGLLLTMSAGANMLSSPISIVTNYSLRTQITVPISSADLPSDKNKMEEFIASLAILVEHSDGEVRLQKGTIQYDEAGNPTGVSIWVDKFSTFTLVKTSFNGTTKAIKNKQMPDKTWTITFDKKIDSSTVTEDTIYLLDSKGNKVDLKLECKANKVKIIPVSYYKAGETYTLYITQNVLYESGTAIEKARKYTFTTANITLAGTKLKADIKINKNKACYINLGETIDIDTIKSKNVSIVDETGKKIQGSASVVLEGNTKGRTVDKQNGLLLIKFEKSLQKGKTYYVLINGINYKKGNTISKAVWIKFTVNE